MNIYNGFIYKYQELKTNKCLSVEDKWINELMQLLYNKTLLTNLKKQIADITNNMNGKYICYINPDSKAAYSMIPFIWKKISPDREKKPFLAYSWENLDVKRHQGIGQSNGAAFYLGLSWWLNGPAWLCQTFSMATEKELVLFPKLALTNLYFLHCLLHSSCLWTWLLSVSR